MDCLKINTLVQRVRWPPSPPRRGLITDTLYVLGFVILPKWFIQFEVILTVYRR